MNKQVETNANASNNIDVKSFVSWFITIIIPLCIFFIPTTEKFTGDIRTFFAITLFIIFIWAFELMHFMIPSILLPVLYIFTNLAPSDKIFSPWGQYIPWMLLGGMILTNIFEDTGLLKRISYWSILKAGGSFRGILYGLMFSGIIIALVIPDIGSRVVMYCALSYGICKALNLQPKTKASSAIMMCGVLAAITPAYIYLSASAQTLIAYDIASKMGVNITWMKYLMYNGLPTLIWCFVSVGILDILFKPEEDISESKEYFKNEYSDMGRLKTSEKKLIVILSALVLLILTSDYHKIAVGWIFLFCTCICFFPGINIGRKENFININYPLVFFVTSCMSIGVVSNVLGAGKFVADVLYPYISGGQIHTIVVSWLLAVILNFVMTPLAAVASVTGPLTEIIMKSKLAAEPILYSWVQGLEQIILPYEYALVLFAFGYGYISLRHLIKAFSIRMILNIVFILVLCVPYWKFIGLF